MRLFFWILSYLVGFCAWQVAAWANKFSFWPQLFGWVCFWLLLIAYHRIENARDHY